MYKNFYCNGDNNKYLCELYPLISVEFVIEI